MVGSINLVLEIEIHKTGEFIHNQYTFLSNPCLFQEKKYIKAKLIKIQCIKQLMHLKDYQRCNNNFYYNI